MHITKSDYLADNSLDCPRCDVPIDECCFALVEPDDSGLEMNCPHCSKKIIVSLEIVNLYTARGA